jgi:sRNA-binding carbon storage regulator CsrA
MRRSNRGEGCRSDEAAGQERQPGQRADGPFLRIENVLVLTRRTNQKVIIDLREQGQGLIEIVVLPGWRIGIDALPGVKILRRELFDRQRDVKPPEEAA